MPAFLGSTKNAIGNFFNGLGTAGNNVSAINSYLNNTALPNAASALGSTANNLANQYVFGLNTSNPTATTTPTTTTNTTTTDPGSSLQSIYDSLSNAGALPSTGMPQYTIDTSALNGYVPALTAAITPIMQQMSQTYGTPGTTDANGQYTGQGGSGLLGSMAATIPQLQNAYGQYQNYLNTTGPAQLQNIATQQMNQNLANQQTGMNAITNQAGQLNQQYTQQEQAADTGQQATSAQASGAAGTPFEAIQQAAADQPYIVQLKNLNANTTQAIAQLVANTNTSNTNIETATEGEIQQMNEQAYAIAPQEIQNIAQINQNIAQTQLQMDNGEISAYQGVFQLSLNIATQQENMQAASDKINEAAYAAGMSNKTANLNAIISAYNATNPNMQTTQIGGKTYLYNPKTGQVGAEITPGGVSGGISNLLNGSPTFSNPTNYQGGDLASILQLAGYGTQ